MAKFKLEDSPEVKDIPVEGFSIENILLFVPVLREVFQIQDDISHLNGNALNLCTQRDVYLDKINVLRTIPVGGKYMLTDFFAHLFSYYLLST